MEILSYLSYKVNKDWMNLPQDQIKEMQKNNLESYINYVFENSIFYKKKWTSLGFNSPKKVFNSFSQIPTLNHTYLLGKDVYSLLASPYKDIKYKFCSGGTTGNPKLILFSKRDWEDRAKYRMRFGQVRNIKKVDIVQLLLPYGIWNVGYSAQSALELLDATILPSGIWMPGQEVLLNVIKEIKPTVLMSTPSLALRIAKSIKSEKFNDLTTSIRLLILTGEDLPKDMRNELTELWGAKISTTYASSEVVIGVECEEGDLNGSEEHNGYHYWADKLYIEVLDQKTGAPLPEGEVGQLAVTPLFGEVMPLIRYKLGDLVKISWKKCKCGLEYPRIWFKGRIKNSFVLPSGVNIFHYQIKEVLKSLNFPVYSYRVLLEDGKLGKDKITFILEVKKKIPKYKKYAHKKFLHLNDEFFDVISQDFIDFHIELSKTEEFRKMEKNRKQKTFVIDKRSYKL